MPDHSLYAALAEELNIALSGGKIDKVIQPSRELVLLTVRVCGESRQLLLSASPAFARVHITETRFEKLPEPPMFCMLLRKHLTGAVIEKIEQMNNDRILCLSLNYADEYGRAFREKLYSEMIPGKINIVLVDEEGLIIDCIYRREYEPDLYRRVFPGMVYHLPRQPENYNARTPVAEQNELRNGENTSAKELSAKAADTNDKRRFTGDGYASLSAFLDDYYSEREKQDLLRRRTKELRASLTSARKRIERKLEAQRLELKRSEGREEARRNADLITANIYRIRKGDTRLICEDFYREGCPETTVLLDPLKTPQENAARLYKQYSKLKTAEEYLTDLIDKAEQQLDYISSAMDELERACSNADIEGIREELTESGIIRSRTGRGMKERVSGEKKNKNSRNGSEKNRGSTKPGKNAKAGAGCKKSAKGAKLSFERTETRDGLEILVGRNNLQNDELTFHTARKTDLWFHVKNYHGSHVVLRTLGSAPSEEDILQAARMAAANSQAAALCSSGRIEVDYTLIRNVHKPAGALPGKVIYTDQTTLIVQPEERTESERI